MITNFLTIGGLLYNPDHDHIAELLHDNKEFLACTWASSACIAKKRMVLGQCEKVMFNQGGWKNARQEQQMRDWFSYGAVYLITIDASYYDQATDRDFCALIEHELYHIGGERDEDSEALYSEMTGVCQSIIMKWGYIYFDRSKVHFVLNNSSVVTDKDDPEFGKQRSSVGVRFKVSNGQLIEDPNGEIRIDIDSGVVSINC